MGVKASRYKEGAKLFNKSMATMYRQGRIGRIATPEVRALFPHATPSHFAELSNVDPEIGVALLRENERSPMSTKELRAQVKEIKERRENLQNLIHMDLQSKGFTSLDAGNIQIEAGKDFVVASIKGSSWAEQPRIPAGAPEAGQWAN